MKMSEIEERVRAVCRTKHWSYKTEVAYLAQIRRYLGFVSANHRGGSSEEKVRAFLESIAPHVAAKTQAQALNAIVFFYRDVVEQQLGDFGNWARAKIPRRLPVWLTVTETSRVLALTAGTHSLMLRLTYGCGLRLMECVRLRVKDVDLERRIIMIRGAKGDKDRALPVPQSLGAPLAEHVQRVRSLWEGDAARGVPPVALPGTLAAKYPNAGREWPWFWVFPGRNLSTDPRSRIVRRHHVHEDGLSKALKAAVRRAGVSKRVTMHVLRHSYATHQLERGVPLHRLRDLLGHNDISTTEIYLHVLPKDLSAAGSPLDDIGGQVVAFPAGADHSAFASAAV